VLRSQGTLNAINAVSHVNATLGLVTAAAVLGQDTIKGMLGGNEVDLETVGKPSEAALQALEKLERERATAPSPSGDGPISGDEPIAGDEPPPIVDPWSDLPSG
jgi:hypothetical protein